MKRWLVLLTLCASRKLSLAWVAQLVERRIQISAEVGGSTPLLAFLFCCLFLFAEVGVDPQRE